MHSQTVRKQIVRTGFTDDASRYGRAHAKGEPQIQIAISDVYQLGILCGTDA
jgi:hypothetical protein